MTDSDNSSKRRRDGGFPKQLIEPTQWFGGVVFYFERIMRTRSAILDKTRGAKYVPDGHGRRHGVQGLREEGRV